MYASYNYFNYSSYVYVFLYIFLCVSKLYATCYVFGIGFLHIHIDIYAMIVQFNSHLFLSPIGARTLEMPVPIYMYFLRIEIITKIIEIFSPWRENLIFWVYLKFLWSLIAAGTGCLSIFNVGYSSC